MQAAPEGGLGARAGGICRALVPVAALAAIAAFGGQERDPAAAAEGSYLGLLIAAVLATVAVLAPLPAAELGLGAVLATAAFWALPPGPLRGAAVALLLLATWGIGLGRRLARAEPGRATSLEPEPGVTALGLWMAAALGAQLLLRGELLFPPEMRWRSLAALLVLPAAGGAALFLLARRHGAGRALTAAAAALVLAPGWTVTSTLTLAALAAGSWLASATALPGGRGLAAAGVPTSRTLPRLAPAGVPTSRTLSRLAAAGVLASPFLWQPRAGWVAVAAGLVLWRPRLALWPPAARGARRWLISLVLPTLLALVALLALVGLARRPLGLDPAASLAWLALGVPGALLPARPRLALAALLLALVTPWIPDRSALAAPLALAALALPAGGPAAAAQRVWSAALAGGTALLASYPWLRADPLAGALVLLGSAPFAPWAQSASSALFAPAAASAPSTLPALATLAPPDLRLAVGVAGAVAALTALSGLALPRVPGLRPAGRTIAAAAAAGGVLLAALLLALPGPGVPLLARVVPLDGSAPVWETDLPAPVAAASLVVDSSLTHAAGLAGGTPVAAVTLRRADGGRLAWTLRAGEGTGEWAARRPDVAAGTRLRSPPAWLSWAEAGFFAQRYRAYWPLPAAGRFVHLRVERSPGLPADLVVALYQLELRQ